jgi:hypothetical protein
MSPSSIAARGPRLPQEAPQAFFEAVMEVDGVAS